MKVVAGVDVDVDVDVVIVVYNILSSLRNNLFSDFDQMESLTGNAVQISQGYLACLERRLNSWLAP